MSRERNHAEEPQQSPLPERLYTVREVADRLRVDATTVRRWVMMGIFPAVILPHQGKRQAYRFTQQSIDAVLNSGMKETLP